MVLDVVPAPHTRENPHWGYGKIEGELLKLGHRVSRSAIKRILRQHGLPPAPERGHSTWRDFLGHYRGYMVACDFFTVDTLFLQRLYVLVFLELGSRRLHFAGCTAHPTAARVTQQARQLSWQLQDGDIPARYLLHDRDSKFVPAFDAVFRSEGVAIIRTPYRAPNANAVAERWIRSARQECLDHLLIVGEAHLRRVLDVYVGFYNRARPHQGLDQRTPVTAPRPAPHGPIQCRSRLGGLLRSYDRESA
jgi:putative transposase